MSPLPRPRGLLRPAAVRVNARIRRLIEEDHDQEHRATEYERLLVQWADATRNSDLIMAA